MDKESDQWETPQALFDELSKEFNFYIDLCANADNCKLWRFADDYLNTQFTEVNKGVMSAFMNPPYSNPLPFITKAWEDSKMCCIVALIKADTSTKTFGVFWDYEKNKPKPGCEVRFLSKRLKFERNGVASKNCANFPSVIVVMDRRGEL